MGANTSKEELLYQHVSYGNVEGIKSLHREGVRLEWIDMEGKTPLILACTRPDLLHVAKSLIELGANVNAYRLGSHAGTPLHHAAKRGLEGTVDLLLSHGANPLVMNDDCKTPLELARAKGHLNVVRVIETRICLFAGWLREIHGPSILEACAPQWVSRKIWVVVLPCDSRNPTNPKKFELAVYPDLLVALPRTVLALWKAQIEEPKFNQADPALIIVKTTKKTRFKFLSAREGDKHQLLWLYNACRGIYQEAPPAVSIPSAPPLSAEMMSGDNIRYPCVDSSPVNLTVPTFESHAISGSETEKDGSGIASASTCVICLDKPVEGACIPCGHMVGCMSCLKEINEKKGECPVCRAKIHQVLRLYAV